MTTLLEDTLVLEEISEPGFQKIIKITDASVGLQAIIAIHDCRLSKVALGGTRLYHYKTFKEALTDATRLARGMTYKSAIAEAGWGGGKSVIIAEKHQKTPQLLAAFGEAVNRLKGEYICAEDVGITTEDLAIIAQHTPYVVGLAHEKSSGDPGPFTAWGTFRGIQAVLQRLFGSDSVAGRTIAIQGLGSVGSHLADFLFWHGAKLIVTDIQMKQAERLAKKYGAKLVAPEEIYDQVCDVFSPCALGGIIHPKTIDRLRCRAVAGSANNQLLTEADGESLSHRGILYAPDFVINAGGLINVTEETAQQGYHPLVARNKVDQIYDQLKLIFEISSQNNISTQQAVMRLADYRLQFGIGKRSEPIYLHHAGISY